MTLVGTGSLDVPPGPHGFLSMPITVPGTREELSKRSSGREEWANEHSGRKRVHYKWKIKAEVGWEIVRNPTHGLDWQILANLF